ncbi:sensor histidine kinase [Pararhodospirillum oryzae]|uniref:histidine kinase n=1 Tax=Pararhodospirillum oryzae TaxID=478448 RepID=A0A512HBR4_9PROT|nr:PAS domain-containing sensor histidine kinase [Pararhodospirillum oryzae]GEO82894.1 two-component sensor histidine kinase [Pararhodospirillum oryzae]
MFADDAPFDLVGAVLGTPGVTLGLAGLVVGMGVGGWVWRARARQRRMRDARDLAQAEAWTLREVLATSADGYALWVSDADETDAFVCSRRLAVLLRLAAGEEASFDDILAGFAPEGAALLQRAVAVLRDENTGFALDLTLETTGRRICAVGVSASTSDGHAVADVVWMRDVTDERDAAETLAARVNALQRERDRLRAVLDALPAPLWIRDDSLMILDGNQAFARALDLGSVPEAVAARRELATGGTGQEMRALAARSRAAGSPGRARFHAVLEGERRLLEITETPLPAGPLAGCTVGAAQDITVIEEVESRLEREVSAHAEVLERLGSAIALFGADTRLIFHNAAFASLWGLEAEWLDGGPGYGDFLERLREDRRLPEVADFPAFKAGELGFFTKLMRPREDILHRPDGATLRRVIAPHPLGGLIASFEDVTDSLALERSYNQLTAVLHETLDHLHEGVAVFGPDGRLRLSNPVFAAQFDLPRPLGDPQVADLLHQLDPGMHPGAAWETFRRRLGARGEGRGARTGRLVMICGRHLDYAMVPLPDGGLLLSTQDISDRVRVERALRERTEALRAADMMRTTFIANVSHELRAPLARLAAREAESLGPDAPLTAELGRLVRIVDEMMTRLGAPADDPSLELDAFDVPAAVAAVLTLGREAAERQGVSVQDQCPADIGWMVADETRVKQIVYHLLSTILAQTPPGGTLTLSVGRGETDGREWIVFTVAASARRPPDGPSSTTEGKGPNTEAAPTASGDGPGLAPVRRLAELHGGTLTLAPPDAPIPEATLRLPAGA